MDSGIHNSENTGASQAKVLLIDLENCPNQLNNLPTDIENYVQVVICYAHSGSKVPLNWIAPLATAISGNKLKIIKMERISKNSADFGICFFAGVLMQELPKETHFVIVSNDIDLDHAVYLLKTQGRAAERIGSSKEEKEVKQSKNIPASGPLNDFCAELKKYINNKPSKVEALQNSINNKFKETPSFAETVYKQLISSGVITVIGTKVSYNDEKIKELASVQLTSKGLA